LHKRATSVEIHTLNPLQKLLRTCVAYVPYRYRWAVFERLRRLFPSAPFVDRTATGVSYVCDLSEAHSRTLFTLRVHEPGILSILQRHVSGRPFVDVGANIGYFTLNLAARATQVIAVEPNPKALTYLQINVELNHLTNVTVYPYALSDTRCLAKMYTMEGATDTSTFVPEENKELTFSVETRTPTDLFDELSLSDTVVKMDVQGFEVILIPALASLFPRVSSLLVSFHCLVMKSWFHESAIQQMRSALAHFPSVYSEYGDVLLHRDWWQILDWQSPGDQMYLFTK
jgi:FkbM family methyltransferase